MMNRKANTLILYTLLCALVVSSFIPLVAQAQTAATGSVLGVVMDPTGATVPGAQVQMVNTANNASMTVVCDDQGKYAIPNVAPGTYTVTTQASGFRQSVVTGVVVEVTKTTNLNIKLVVGGISSTVEVSAQSAQMELQTADATIGDIVGTEALLRLPTRSRSAQELLLLQPGTTRQTGSGTGASIAGAENNQTTFTLDGIDITDQNTNSTVDTEHGARPVVAVSVDSVDEFRVGVTNSNASFGRSSGGQVTLIGRSGTNALHGAGFWYHQNSVLNANSWDNNRLGIPKPSLRDNRFGGRFGGPVIKDKTFYFVDYEGRRYPQQLAFSRTVPTAAMRQGILQFRDASGNVIAYNLATAQVCGSSGNAACDPRGIGISPSMKALFGLSYGWQTPVTFRDQKEAFLIDAATSQILTEDGYLSDKRDAALRGQIYNPLLGFLPVAKSGRSSVYDADYGNIAPRIAAAWSPSYSNGLLGKIFGKERTVLRGGFGIYCSRINGEATVVGPGLTAGFTSTLTTGLTNCRVSGAPGQGCNSTSTSDPAQSTFRVGVDGPIPIPIVTNVSSPIIPAGNYSELASYSIDPGIKLPRIYTANFTVQSRVAHGVILEVGWSGRYGRRLLANSNINANPYFFLDTASNQTFAQAFDVVATALRAGQTPAAQAWFENQLPGAGGTATSTAFLISKYRSSFTTGLVSTLFSNIDNIRLSMGKQAYDEMQVNQLRMLGNSAYSNYNAMMATVRRNGANFSFNVNYTFSKSLDSYLGVQNDSGCLPNPYYPGVNYGPSSFDRTHTLNARFIYNLPSRWSGVGGALNKILGGWYISGIFSADSGIPLTVTESSQVYGGGQTNVNSTGAIPIVSASAMDQGVHGGVAGSGGVGTNGNPATGGSGLNMFADPQAAFNNFRPVLLSADMRNGRSNPLRGLPLWNLDSSIGKKLPITERVNWVFSFDFYNMLNHVSFNNPSLNLTSPATFGVISSSVVPANRQAGSRWIMFGTRIEF